MRHLYDMGDKVFGPYGFYDAFSETDNWYPQRYLAIDQGPIAVMIENYRSGLLWKLFMSHPDVQQGLRKLGFQLSSDTPFPLHNRDCDPTERYCRLHRPLHHHC